jgi:hypothetical protein
MGHANAPAASVCTIRRFRIRDPFWTYCANHPQRRPDRDPVPIGPVLVNDGRSFPCRRKLLRLSPDMEEARQHLLELLRAVEEQPDKEYPVGPHLAEVVVRQLGKWREARALAGLERITKFAPGTAGSDRTHETLIADAHQAIEKIKAG